MDKPSEQWKREAATLFESSVDQYATERESEPWYRTQLSFAMAAVAGRHGRVLDLGCAAGAEIAQLRAASFSVIGADFVEQMLRVARQRFAHDPHVAVIRADAEFLPFGAGSFDVVFCLGVLEYVRSYEPSLLEIHRVLGPGGLAVITLPSRISICNVSSVATETVLSPIWRATKRMLGRARRGHGPPHSRNLCVPRRFRALLSKLGFEPMDFATTGFFVEPLRLLWPQGHDRFASALEPLGRSRWFAWMGSQFMVVARKRDVAGAI